MDKKMLFGLIGAGVLAFAVAFGLGRVSGKVDSSALRIELPAPSTVVKISAADLVRVVYGQLQPEDRTVLSDSTYAVPDESFVKPLLVGWEKFRLALVDRGWRDTSWDCDDYSLAFHLYCRLATRTLGLPGTLSEGQLYRRSGDNESAGHAKNVMVVARKSGAGHELIVVCIEPQTPESFAPRDEDRKLTTHTLF